MFPLASLSSARTQRGGTLFGAIGGLLIGLVVAVLVAIYVTKAPVPFVNRGLGRAPDTAAVDPSKAPDPNRGLYGTRDAPAGMTPPPVATTPSTEGVAPPAPAPGTGPAASGGTVPPPGTGAWTGPGAIASAPSAAPQPARAQPPADDGSTYFLQVGAFRVVEDAEAFKARLALQGFEAFVASAQVNSNTVYRVRLGPFRRLDDMNRARARLADSKIEASVIKTR